MISVCLTTFNGEKFLEKQLDSIFSVLHPEDEVLIGDDGSSDGTIEILKKYSKKNVYIFENNYQNVVKNIEFLLQRTSNSIITFADQDDFWLPNRREIILSHLKGQTNRCLLMNGKLIDENDKDLSPTVFEKWKTRLGFYANLRRNTFMGAGMAFSADLKRKILPFPTDIPMHDWWIGLLVEKLGTVILEKTPTFCYRLHGKNNSLQGSSFSQKLKWRADLLQHIQIRLQTKDEQD